MGLVFREWTEKEEKEEKEEEEEEEGGQVLFFEYVLTIIVILRKYILIYSYSSTNFKNRKADN